MLFSFVFRFRLLLLLLPEPVSIFKAGSRRARKYSCLWCHNYGAVFITQYSFNVYVELHTGFVHHILFNRKAFCFAHRVFFGSTYFRITK